MLKRAIVCACDLSKSGAVFREVICSRFFCGDIEHVVLRHINAGHRNLLVARLCLVKGLRYIKCRKWGRCSTLAGCWWVLDEVVDLVLSFRCVCVA